MLILAAIAAVGYLLYQIGQLETALTLAFWALLVGGVSLLVWTEMRSDRHRHRPSRR